MSTLPDYRIRRSDRARRVRVWVHPDGDVEVVLPRRCPDGAAAEAMVELAPWIERKRAEALEARESVGRRDGVAPYMGTDLVLRPQPGRTRVHRKGQELLVPAGDPRPALERWYRRMARIEIAPRLDLATEELGVRYTKLTVRNQRTRWGSCSTSGAMSFNWRLLLGPEEVLDYVVWHEACHLKVMDHSSAFWSLLARHYPGYEDPRWWLRRHGGTLVL